MPHFPAEPDLPDELLAGFQNAGVSPAERLTLAVSGGIDSIALLHAVCLLRESTDGLLVAHLDHGLRPGSSEDRLFVEQLAEKLGIPCYVTSLPQGYLADQPGSVEEAARRKRYEFLCEAAAEHDCQTVLTAHHRLDQAETVLHNLLRGTGLRGLGGMHIQRPLSKTVRLVRPLRHVSRKNIERFVNERGLQFRIDESNADTSFTRNRIRHETMPLLQQFNPRLEETLAKAAEQARSAVQVMDEFAQLIVRQCLLEQQPDVVRLRRQPLSQLSDPARRHVLSWLWTEQGWSRQKLTADHWCELARLLDHADTRLHLPGFVCATTTTDMLRLIRTSGPPKTR